MVEAVRHDEAVSLKYMKAYERKKMLLERGEVCGHAELIRNMKTMTEEEKQRKEKNKKISPDIGIRAFSFINVLN